MKNEIPFEKYIKCNLTGVSLDLSKTLKAVNPISDISAMENLERGAISNSTENRMVGHYWLRAPELSPTNEIKKTIQDSIQKIKAFTAKIHNEGKFKDLLLIGIGGSALGPQFVTAALSGTNDKMGISFFDNTDPNGFERTLSKITDLSKTLTIVISKSGGTKETRNGMLVASEAYKRAGLDFKSHAVSITGEGSELYNYSAEWLERFPMWDWVGGRTSEMSAVGLLPAALQGFDIDSMLNGAREMDINTRGKENNLAGFLAQSWLALKGRAMVVLPYSDRLELFSKYLQQLVMESLGKKQNRKGEVVFEGLTVYGNKGSTDQHAYVQQLRDGLNNFFVVFIRVLKNPSKNQVSGIEVENGITSSDYLDGFLLGTRRALFEAERPSITITIPEVTPYYIGALIALFERTVGFYAELIDVNAYDQPGVEAGKKAASDVLNLQEKIILNLEPPKTVEELVAITSGSIDEIYYICERLAFNGQIKDINGRYGKC